MGWFRSNFNDPSAGGGAVFKPVAIGDELYDKAFTIDASQYRNSNQTISTQPVVIENCVNNMFSMFSNCGNFNGKITFNGNNFNANLGQMFYNCRNFNQPITINCITNCDNISGGSMFSYCSNFNSPVKINCNFSSTSSMFSNCRNFNSILSLGNSNSCSYMFFNCTKFNQPLKNICLSENSYAYYYMLYNCNSFNADIEFVYNFNRIDTRNNNNVYGFNWQSADCSIDSFFNWAFGNNVSNFKNTPKNNLNIRYDFPINYYSLGYYSIYNIYGQGIGSGTYGYKNIRFIFNFFNSVKYPLRGLISCAFFPNRNYNIFIYVPNLKYNTYQWFYYPWGSYSFSYAPWNANFSKCRIFFNNTNQGFNAYPSYINIWANDCYFIFNNGTDISRFVNCGYQSGTHYYCYLCDFNYNGVNYTTDIGIVLGRTITNAAYAFDEFTANLYNPGHPRLNFYFMGTTYRTINVVNLFNNSQYIAKYIHIHNNLKNLFDNFTWTTKNEQNNYYYNSAYNVTLYSNYNGTGYPFELN